MEFHGRGWHGRCGRSLLVAGVAWLLPGNWPRRNGVNDTRWQGFPKATGQCGRRPSLACTVKKAAPSSGRKPHLATALGASNQSSNGGNETAEAFDYAVRGFKHQNEKRI